MNTNHIFALAVLGGILGKASGATLIQDSFTADIASINGTSPDIGSAWGGPASWGTSGGELSITSSNTASINGLSLRPNSTYVLSMDVNVTSGGQGWVGLGFLTPAHVSVNNGAVGGYLIREDSGPGRIQLFASGSSSVQDLSNSTTLPQNLSIELEIGVAISNSTLTWKLNNTQIGTSQTVDASAVNGVFIQSNGGRGVVDNFMLTGPAVPEPSSTLLLGLAGLGMTFRRRR